jgi:hypothetical protein
VEVRVPFLFMFSPSFGLYSVTYTVAMETRYLRNALPVV